MDYREHTVTLKSALGYGKRVPPGAFGEILRGVSVAVDWSILMAFEGTSAAVRGRHPNWFAAATDLRFLGHEGKEDTILHFEAPVLGDAAEVLYRQTEMWPTKPAREDTGFDLLADVIEDVAIENADSDRFDSGLLGKISRVGKKLNGTFQELRITGHRYPEDRPAVLDSRLVELAEQFRARTPLPQRARLVGELDMLRASTNSFAIKLDDGQEVRGVLTEGEIERLTELFRKDVLVLGKCVYRPSGRLLRVDANRVVLAGDEPRLWSRTPDGPSARLEAARLKKPQGPRSGLAAIIGRWPGDETDEEISAELDAVS